MAMRYFDTHAHYTDKRFTDEYEGGAEALLGTVFASGVEKIINVGTNIENSIECCNQAKAFNGMYAAAGIHPSDCKDLFDVDSEMSKLTALLDRKDELKIVAVGEIGLDYYWDNSYKDLQLQYFERQLDIAAEYGLPAIIHDREAHGDCFETILRHPHARGILHSFSGSPEMALELVRRGWYISFSGVVSFKNSRKAREVAAAIPEDKILIETDCPYLAPEPFRGRLNRSDYLKYTLKAIADVRNSDEEALSLVIFNNSINAFCI